jgi:hypothetical protein
MIREPGSSVSVVSDYGLDDSDRGSIPGRGKVFSSSLCVQTGYGAHPASCTMGTGGKARPWRDRGMSLERYKKITLINIH